MVSAEHLSKRYGATTALQDVSFEIGRGEVVGLLGQNGAGKSTTMRILAGYIPATAGRARIAGHDVFSDSLEARRRIGYLPEGAPLYSEMRVREYLAYRAHIKGIPSRERGRRVEQTMEQCGLGDAGRRPIGALSKGYRQRVGLADALVHDPPVLILDEPTIGLAPVQVRDVRALIRDLGTERTVLLSTHILTEVEMLCRRVLIIHRGLLVFQDTLANLTHGAARVVVEMTAPENATAALRQIPGVTAVRESARGDARHFELDAAPGADVREAVYHCAVRNGWTLREIRRHRPSLEEVFVRATAEEAA